VAGPVSHYTFLPWFRTGLGSAVKNTEDGRANLDVTIEALIGGVEEPFTKHVHLISPGDLIGIDPRAVVRVEPRPFTNEFEPNYLAAIEFFDEDYPWRYSPSKPDADGHKDHLDPWIALLVLEEGEFTLKDQGEGLPRSVSIKNTSILPPPEELWAWAHSHLNAVVADQTKPRATADQIAANPAVSCSRIIAARHLLPEKAYHAFLVPAFESGRRAGLLSKDGPDRPYAWDRLSPGVELPVYFEWSFRTSTKGDFKELALRLKAHAADPTVGRRPMDVSHPLEFAAFPPIRNTDVPSRAVLALEGALQVPDAQPSGWSTTSKAAFQQKLADFINLSEAWELQTKQVKGEPPLPHGVKLPVVLPPSYGRFHANVNLLDAAKADSRWLEQINLDPRNRVAAAFGTLVVQKNQEDFMARAWKQYGELFQANRLRFRAQFFREMLTTIEAKHISNLSPEKTLAVTSLMQARVVMSGVDTQITVRGHIEASALPLAVLQPAMRRVLRDEGAVAKRFGTRVRHLNEITRDVASTKVSVSPAWNQPAERLTLSTEPKTQSPGAPNWLGNDWDLLKPHVLRLLDSAQQLVPRVPQLSETIRVLQGVISTAETQSTLAASRLVPEAVTEVRAAPQWAPLAVDRATLRPQELLPSRENPNFSFMGWNFREAALSTSELLTIAIPQPAARVALDVNHTASVVKGAISPYVSVNERISRVLKIPSAIRMPDYDPLEKIMAHPRFDDPTYEPLKKISQDYVVPNLSKIRENTITLLEINWRFIESYLVGLNHEMARELLWRGYPTDQRGSYFRLFWDVRIIPGAVDSKGRIVEKFLDIHPIHGWKLGGQLTLLGDNRPKGRLDVKNLVLVIRGDLLRRYPNTHVYACRAIANPDPRKKGLENMKRRPEDDETKKDSFQEPILFAKFDPDIYCYGFNLEKGPAMGNPNLEGNDLGWYFVLAERFGEPRFGLDSNMPPKSAHPTNSDDLNWANLVADPDKLGAVILSTHQPDPKQLFTDPGNATWNKDAADMASILLREPARVFYHANDMLKPKQ
jgi:hypothetical protein